MARVMAFIRGWCRNEPCRDVTAIQWWYDFYLALRGVGRDNTADCLAVEIYEYSSSEYWPNWTGRVRSQEPCYPPAN